MRKVILCLAASFDGFIEGPNGEIDWIVFDDEGASYLTEFIQEIDTVLYGRVSYEMWGNYGVTESSSEFEKSFYGELGKMDKYVFSNSRNEFEGNVKVVSSDIPDFINDLKQRPGKNIWLYGGGKLITTFMNLNLVDEFRVALIPVIIGQGTPMFKGIKNRHQMKLVEATTSRSGVLSVRYETVR